MNGEMTFAQNEDGTFSAYDDTYDITIHCETEEEQKKVIERLKATNWIPVSADVMIWTVMNMRRIAKNMRLIDLLATIGADVESDEEIQICHPGRNWEDYDEFNAGSKLLKPFYDLKVKSLSAINTDVIRVDLAFDEKGGETDE